jgi:SAM-dependent methyltransferase
MSRSTKRELLDHGAQRDLEELRGNLRDMERYDRWLGALRTQLRLAQAAPGSPALGLDVGAGAAGFLHYARQRSTMRWIGLDLSRDVLCIAGERRTGAGDLICADGLRLPFADDGVDVVACAHLVHHLDPDHAVALLQECARVARRRVVAIDLNRGWLTIAGAWLLTRATSANRMTRADGVLSARRAYTPAEVRALAHRAGLARAQVRRHGPARLSLVWDK